MYFRGLKTDKISADRDMRNQSTILVRTDPNPFVLDLLCLRCP